ncbi:hypothetical protein N7457_009729 [Penicillium paradoxum]|uniref:uncharacterized protein n=1 Tax=Penicillium paradoxum TaxID=176176 RepID=UPI002549503B|nr:uncharacterized protein N7457_009729 [Penicillium paradoxum]KAJ5774833.1 hypothetical protein N7457_009729 [Penicillium paradoxum]
MCNVQQSESGLRISSGGTKEEVKELQREKSSLLAFIRRLKLATPEQREAMLAATPIDHPKEEGRQWECQDEKGIAPEPEETSGPVPRQGSEQFDMDSEDEDIDIAPFISIDESGKPGNFGPSSALYVPNQSEQVSPPASNQTFEHRRNTLIANAALQRQSEHYLSLSPSIGGAPTEVALHLLNVHWTRQHHTFLLTYRPAIIRDLQQNGPYCSELLLNAIFACSNKFSDVFQQENHFFLRCESFLTAKGVIMKPTIPTLVALLLLGSTCVAKGETSKGWLFTGYALRMVYDLGLNIDPRETTDNSEEIEIRRRVFWGAYVCDKLQSLYLGRPVAINTRDHRVSRELFDTFEEKELFLSTAPRPSPIYSVSTFQQLCLLSKIMTLIINRFYVVGASFANARSNLQLVDNALNKWKQNLPEELNFTPPAESPMQYPSPNVMVLHAIYYSLVILLHRPFISDGHLRSATTPQHSWEKCSSAAQMISSIAETYRLAYGLPKAPYILSYAIYVASTIHVRNAAGDGASIVEHKCLLISCLEYLSLMSQTNPGVDRPLSIIKQLIMVNDIDLDRGRALRSIAVQL